MPAALAYRRPMRVLEVARIGAVTGEDSPNRTGSRFGVYATDLGIMWDNGRDEVLIAFGDSYGQGWGGFGSGPPEADWRCNLLGRSTTRDLDHGLSLDSMVSGPDGKARQVIARDTAVSTENSVIPTSGIAVGDTNYMHYMSVARWGEPGHWETNYGGIAVSEDGGQTWRKPASARWIRAGRRLWSRGRAPSFHMGAFAADGERVYLFGTPGGRFGSASLARVAADRVAYPTDYEYWTPAGWRAGEPRAAIPVLSGPVGELSVCRHEGVDRWLALHLDERRSAILLRWAPEVTGPWSDGVALVTAADFPGLYGGYLHPWALSGPTIYFTLSHWGPYNVSLMRATLA